jgi:hypothetical protein
MNKISYSSVVVYLLHGFEREYEPRLPPRFSILSCERVQPAVPGYSVHLTIPDTIYNEGSQETEL